MTFSLSKLLLSAVKGLAASFWKLTTWDVGEITQPDLVAANAKRSFISLKKSKVAASVIGS